MNGLMKKIANYINKNKSPYPILIILSHGSIDLDSEEVYTTPIKIKKINAATIGCQNYTIQEQSDKFVEDVLTYMNENDEKSPRKSKKMIKEIQKKMRLLTDNVISEFNKSPYEKSINKKLFIKNKKYHNKMCKAKKGDELLGKLFTKEKDENYDTLILNHDGKKIVLDNFYHLHDDNETKFIHMPELLEIIKNEFQIDKLIIADLSCSCTTENDEKFCKRVRKYMNRFIKYGGKTFKKKIKGKQITKRRQGLPKKTIKTRKTIRLKKTKRTTIRRNKTHKNKIK